MYALLRTYTQSHAGLHQWILTDISALALVDVFANYNQCVVVLSNSSSKHELCLDLQSLPASSKHSALTLPQFLQANGDALLNTTDVLPGFAQRFVRYIPAFRGGYSIQSALSDTLSEAAALEPEQRWLSISKEDEDPCELSARALVSVNGYFHRVDCSSGAARIIDGNVTRLINGEANVGLYDFSMVGKLRSIALTQDMLFKRDPAQPYSQCVYAQLGESLEPYTVAVVLGGYLLILEPDIVTPVSDSVIRINTSNFPFLARWMESRDHLDTTGIPLESHYQDGMGPSVDVLYSDAMIAAYLTLPQSFVVLIDNRDLVKERIPVQTSGMPGMLISDTLPEYPLINSQGKIEEYWHSYEDPEWSITIIDKFRHRSVYGDILPLPERTTYNSRGPASNKHSDMHFIKLSSGYGPA